MTTAERIYKAVRPLPEPLAQEVLDFVEFLSDRYERFDDLMLAQESSLRNIWDNPEDEVWNNVGRG